MEETVTDQNVQTAAKRKRPKLPEGSVRVVEYGARLPKLPRLDNGRFDPQDPRKIANDFLFRANQYRNKQIELYRRNLDRWTEVRSIHIPGYKDIQDRIFQIRQEIKDIHATVKQDLARQGKVVSGTALSKLMDAAVRLKEQELRNLYDQERDLRKSAPQHIVDEMKRLDKDNAECLYGELKVLRNESGVPPSMYDAVDPAVKAQVQQFWKNRMDKNPQTRAKASINFHRFDGSGNIVAGTRAGRLTQEDLFSQTDTHIVLGDPLPLVHHKTSQNPWRAGKIRIGSDSKRKPIWLPFHFKWHEDIPADGTVTKVVLHFKRVGLDIEVKMLVYVVRDGGWRDRLGTAREGAVAVDIGWRKLPNGDMRVAYWRDDNGVEGEFKLSKDFFDREQKVRDVKSIEQKHFDDAKLVVHQWLRMNTVPDWLHEQSRYLTSWNSRVRLNKLYRAWKEKVNEVPGSDDVIVALEKWHERYCHLYQWYSHQTEGSISRRLHQYRVFADFLADKYGTIVLEDIDWRVFGRKKGPNGESLPEAYKEQRMIASPGLLSQILRNKAWKASILDPSNTTQACQHCGHIDNFDAASNLTHTCTKCGASWDQDQNACVNLLKRHVGAAASQQVAATSP